MESLFTRLYKYRQRENKSDLENFSTELLTYCLETDLNFQKSFLEFVDCNDNLIMHISTQEPYPTFGRPDVEIITENSIILIENKVESFEGYNQLDRYVSILQQNNNRHKHLIYLTKFYECKEISDKSIKFKNIKWWDVNMLIDEKSSEITKIFGEYLIENELAMDKNFKNIDLVSLENIANVISKMDEVIDSVKSYFGSKIGSFSKDSSRSTRLQNQAYYNYKSIGDPFKFNIDLGYFWWWGNQQIYFGIRIWIPYKNDEKNDLISYFKENLTEWEEEPWEKTVSFGNYKNMSEIIGTEEEQLPTMISFLKKNIDVLHDLKLRDTQIFA